MTSTASTVLECPTEKAILHALLYFELFSYPLTATEVLQYSSESGISAVMAFEKLQNLVNQGLAFQFGPYFQTQHDASWVPMRQECNQRADQFLPIARRRSRLIGAFPFVRGVFVSGSLSKHSMRADGDIDFFIITAPGRLWLARTLLILFKKVCLLNSHKYFCVNYFIDTEHLTIEEQNLFTATETVTLLPMYGREYFESFRQANAWAWEQYPNFPLRSTDGVPPHTTRWLKRILEKTWSGNFGAWLDEKLMRMTVLFWQRKFKHLQGGSFEIALKSRRYVSKHHPLHFQQKVLDRLDTRIRECAADF